MSTIAWDGTWLAADRQSTDRGHIELTTKCARLVSGELVAWAGYLASGLRMAQWYRDGADPQAFPDCQRDNDRWAYLIVVRAPDDIVVYEREPIALRVQDPIAAWGTGRDFALGAMAMGATAAQAVEIASRFDIYTGMGINVFSFHDCDEAVLLARLLGEAICPGCGWEGPRDDCDMMNNSDALLCPECLETVT